MTINNRPDGFWNRLWKVVSGDQEGLSEEPENTGNDRQTSSDSATCGDTALIDAPKRLNVEEQCDMMERYMDIIDCAVDSDVDRYVVKMRKGIALERSDKNEAKDAFFGEDETSTEDNLVYSMEENESRSSTELQGPIIHSVPQSGFSYVFCDIWVQFVENCRYFIPSSTPYYEKMAILENRNGGTFLPPRYEIKKVYNTRDFVIVNDKMEIRKKPACKEVLNKLDGLKAKPGISTNKEIGAPTTLGHAKAYRKKVETIGDESLNPQTAGESKQEFIPKMKRVKKTIGDKIKTSFYVDVMIGPTGEIIEEEQTPMVSTLVPYPPKLPVEPCTLEKTTLLTKRPCFKRRHRQRKRKRPRRHKKTN